MFHIIFANITFQNLMILIKNALHDKIHKPKNNKDEI